MKSSLIAVAVAAATMTAGVAHADQHQTWTGVSVGIGVGAGAVVHDLGIDAGEYEKEGRFPLLSAGFDGIGGEGMLGTLSVGADWQFHKNFLIGAFFDYDFTDIETTLDFSAGGFLSGKGNIQLDDMWSIGGRIGFLPTPNTVVYGLVAYTEANFDDAKLSVSCGECGSHTASLALPSFSGVSFGGGIETQLFHNVTLKGEYRFTQLDRETVFSYDGYDAYVDASLEPSIHTGRVSVNYRFNFDRHAEPAPLK
jgi:outer membrane immunogenic protein